MRCINNQSGFSLVQLLVAATVFTIVSLGIMNLIVYYSKMEQQQRLMAGLMSARYRLISYLQDERGWAYTITSPENSVSVSSECFIGNTAPYDCMNASFPNPPIEMAVYSPNGNVYYNTIGNPNVGFNRDGEVCYTYDAVNGSFNCPFRAVVQWQAICPGSPCYDPSIQVEILFTLSQSDAEKKLSFNPGNYNFVFQK